MAPVALAVEVAALLGWWNMPARRRPSSLPEGATIVDEAVEDGIYSVRLDATEDAFVRWVDGLGMVEDEPEDGLRWWSHVNARCESAAHYDGELGQGFWSRACAEDRDGWSPRTSRLWRDHARRGLP